MKCPKYKPPFPYFGGKSRIAAVVWARLGDAPNYIEPFFGSGSILFKRPAPGKYETINDLDGMVANFWRALQHAPDEVAYYADWPIIENDLHARHAWLLERKESLQARLEGDPHFYDPKIAGWWVWGISNHIGSGWCSGNGPWKVVHKNGVRILEKSTEGGGIKRSRPQAPPPRGIHRRSCKDIYSYLRLLAERLKRVIVCCGDWRRVCTSKTALFKTGVTAIFFDPPYSKKYRDRRCYSTDPDEHTAEEVRDWCLANGNDPMLRIALCGYREEHQELEAAGWERHDWVRNGGYSNRNKDNQGKYREAIWFSPHCLKLGEDSDAAPLWRYKLAESQEAPSDGRRTAGMFA